MCSFEDTENPVLFCNAAAVELFTDSVTRRVFIPNKYYRPFSSIISLPPVLFKDITLTTFVL